MRLMFRLIRLNADFDQVTYILAFDRSVVESVLSEEQGVSGSDYLEKIVQVGFDIPLPEPGKLKRIFLEAFETLELGVDNSEENIARWVDLQTGGLERLIRTPRDIVRYANSLRINGAMAGEVNPVDFAGIEAIRTFAPTLYTFIRDNRSIFVRQAGGSVIFTEPGERDESKKRLDEALSSCEPELQVALRDICEQLFPEIETLYRNTTFGGSFHQGWRRSHRICSVDIFPRYFYLRPFEDEVTMAEFQSIIGEANDRCKLAGHLRKLIAGGRVDSFLERLADAAEEITSERLDSTVIALFDVSEALETGFYFENQVSRLCRTVFMVLNEHQQAVRLGALRHAAESAESLFGVIYFVSLYSDEPTLPERALFENVEWNEIRSTILSRIMAAAKDGSLTASRHLGEILFRWRDWSSANEPQEFVSDLTRSDEGLMTFLEGMLARRDRSVGRYASRRGWYISLDGVKTLIDDAMALAERVRLIKDQQWGELSERQKVGVESFLAAIEGTDELP